MSRQVWWGNIPMAVTEAQLMQFFASVQVPVPWKALVRESAGSASQFCIATYETVADAQAVLGLKNFRWMDGTSATIKPPIILSCTHVSLSVNTCLFHLDVRAHTFIHPDVRERVPTDCVLQICMCLRVVIM